EGCRDNCLEPVRWNRRILGDLDRHVDEVVEVRRADAVPAAHLGPPRLRKERVRREAGAADSGEPDPAALKRQGQSAPPRSPRRRPGARAAAWSRPWLG